MGYWLKSFNKKPYPVPGKHYSVGQINTLPLPGTAFFIVVSLVYAWSSDALGGRRWPFIYLGALITLSTAIPLRVVPLYDNIKGHFALYWLSFIGEGAGPLIMSWINEINSHDTEKRALLVAMGNDFAYVIQAIGPNFYWKTSEFPAARKGWTAVIVYNIILSRGRESGLISVAWTTLILVLLRRDRRRGGKSGEDTESVEEIAHVDTDSDSKK